MKQIERVERIQNVKRLLSLLTIELSITDLTNTITPEGRILNDVSDAVLPQGKRVEHALRLAESHN